MSTTASAPTAAPCSGIDLFADSVLTDPYDAYDTLREIGPAVWLTKHQVWAVTRHRDIRDALLDAETYSSVDGIALTETANRDILAGTVLAADGAEHARLRRPLSRQLNPRAMRDLLGRIDARAKALTLEYVARGHFDAVELAQHYVADNVMELMGLPDSTRGQIIENTKATFDCFGPDNARYRQSAPAAAAMVAFLHQEVSRETVRPGSWMDALYTAADAGEISETDVVPLMSAYTAAGMDTTIYGISTALHLLATHPKQWAHLRAGRANGTAVFREAIRLEAPVQGFGRRVTRDTSIGGTSIAAGQQVWLLYGAAGRDPHAWGPRADQFDIRRPGTEDHLSLGAGPHLCAGNHLAQAEAHCLLEHLSHYCKTLTPAGTPVRALNNVLRGFAFASVPIDVTVDRRRTFP